MNEDAPTPIIFETGDKTPESITLEHLQADPETFRPLILQLATMPMSRSVTTVVGRQAEQLVDIGLDTANLDTFEDAVDRVFAGEPITEDSRKALELIESAAGSREVGAKRAAEQQERILRKRLVAVADYLAELIPPQALRKPA